MKKSNKFSPEVRERAVIAVGGDRVDCTEDRLRAADAERMGQA